MGTSPEHLNLPQAHQPTAANPFPLRPHTSGSSHLIKVLPFASRFPATVAPGAGA